MNFDTSSQCYVCLIVGDDTCDDTYSARLYKAKEKKKIIFCMCLCQPEYIKVILQCNNNYIFHSFCFIVQRCDTAIVTKYRIEEEGREPDVLDEVTITVGEVKVKEKYTREWTTFYRIKPASVSVKFL